MGKRRSSPTETTELEAAVLGVVWQEGPCTAYAIRQHFLDSPTPRWSGSAGAIYPLVRRLEARRLLKSTPNARGRREQRDFRITRLGEAALQRWLRAPIAQGEAGLVHDPLRTRMLFLNALSGEEIGAFFSDALEVLRNALQQAKLDCRNNLAPKDPFVRLAARNALLVTRARLRWLAEARKQLGTSGACDAT